MKKVQLKQLAAVNFKGHKDLTVNFADQTTISGRNKAGKSTIFDAFVWLLFGIDQFDRKDYEIIPTIDNKMLERVDSEVSAIIIVDGREISLKRVLHQKWVRKRGTAEEVFDGCETLYYMNEAPLKASEYKARIDLIVDETIFKLITNPATFLALHWTKQREFLFNIAGTVSDIEALDKMATLTNKDAIFNLTNILNSGKSLIEYKKEISAKKKKLKEDLDNISPRIDQTTRLMPEAKDWDKIASEIDDIDEQIKRIDQQMTDRAAAIRGQYDEIQAKQGQINDLKSKQREILNKKQTEAQTEAFTANQDREKVNKELKSLVNQVDTAKKEHTQAENQLNQLKSKAEALNKEIEKLRADWEAENAKEYQAKAGCLICPAFGHECSDQTALSKYEEENSNAFNAFMDAKEKKLDAINLEGKNKADELSFIQGRINDGVNYLTEADKKVLSLTTDYEKRNELLINWPVAQPKKIISIEVKEWVDLENDIMCIEATMQDTKPVDNSDLLPRKKELTSKIDELKKQLSERDVITRNKAEIERLKAEGSNLAQQIADLEKTEFTIDAFNKVKIDECDRRVNGLFEIVKFKLFDKTIEGNEFECCIPCNKSGVPIAATNNAEEINAGLDIIRTLSQFYNVSAPIFCDNAESVNEYLNTGSQMVYLTVTKEPELTISNI
jgi:uncharacterized coiled-coil DUF342 family protein